MNARTFTYEVLAVVCRADDSVIEPAAFKNVIAVAGSTPSGHPRDESHRGPNVDITAPADAIWLAEAAAKAGPGGGGRGERKGD